MIHITKRLKKIKVTQISHTWDNQLSPKTTTKQNKTNPPLGRTPPRNKKKKKRSKIIFMHIPSPPPPLKKPSQAGAFFR